MHIAAASPLALDPAGLDPAVTEREKAVLADKNAGKPAHVLEKIVESGLKTYYKEVCLLDQPFVHDPSQDGRPGRKGEPKAASARRWRSRASCASRSAKASRSRRRLRGRSGRGWPARAELFRNGGLSAAVFVLELPCRPEISMPRTTKRVLVKLSGEALIAPDGYWLNPQTLIQLAAGSRRRSDREGSRSPSSSAAATSSAAPRSAQPDGSTGPLRMPWACWRRS